MDNFFTGFNLVALVSKWKWHFFVITIIAAAVGFLVSRPFIMVPKFKSTAVVYPSNITPYSDENETEQMIQWLTSQDVRDSVINHLKLAQHYSLDLNYKYFLSTINYFYDKNVRISKTQYMSIEITATDKDPKMAYNLVNTIVDFTNLKIRITHKEKFEEVLNSFRVTLSNKQHEIDSAKALLNQLNTNKNIASTIARYLDVSGVTGSENISSSTTAVKQADAGDILFLTHRIQGLAEELSVLIKNYDLAVHDCNRQLTYLNIVTKPFVADQKYLPKTSVIVLVFSLSAFVLALLGFALIDRWKKTAN